MPLSARKIQMICSPSGPRLRRRTTALVSFNGRDGEIVSVLNDMSIKKTVVFIFEDDDHSRRIDDDHGSFSSSIISFGERGSSSGRAVTFLPRAIICSTVIRCLPG